MKKILIIDDSKTMRRIVSNTVIRIGIKKENITEAEDGAVAIEKLQKLGYDYFDTILCDINMPNANGYDVLKNVRSNNKDVPIIMITTEGGKVEVIKALKMGCNNYIVKPFTPQVLKEKLTPLIGEI